MRVSMTELKTKEGRRKFYNSVEWRALRDERKMLDHYECQWCANEGYVNVGKDPERGVLEVDHILEVSERPDLAYDFDNTRTLCKYHHNQRHHRFQFKSNNKNNKITFRKSEWWGK